MTSEHVPRVDEQAVRQILEADRDATLGRLASMTAELDAVAAASAGSNLDDEHDPEGATVAFEREQIAALRVQAQRHLAESEAALERLSAGRYGVCERCGNPVGAERLDALPTARLCIPCAAKQSNR